MGQRPCKTAHILAPLLGLLFASLPLLLKPSPHPPASTVSASFSWASSRKEILSQGWAPELMVQEHLPVVEWQESKKLQLLDLPEAREKSKEMICAKCKLWSLQVTFSLDHHFFSAEGLQTMRSEVQRIATEVFIFISLFYRNIIDLQYYISFRCTTQ